MEGQKITCLPRKPQYPNNFAFCGLARIVVVIIVVVGTDGVLVIVATAPEADSIILVPIVVISVLVVALLFKCCDLCCFVVVVTIGSLNRCQSTVVLVVAVLITLKLIPSFNAVVNLHLFWLLMWLCC